MDTLLGFLSRPCLWKLTLGRCSGSPLAQVKQRAIEFRYCFLTSRHVSGGGLETLFRVEPGPKIPIYVLVARFAKRSRGTSDAIFC
jgi:hypothetical protein